MKRSLIFVLFLLKLCASYDFKCGLSGNGMESLEFYCENFATIPEGCLPSLTYASISDKSKVTRLKIAGCDEEITKLIKDFTNLLNLDLSHNKISTLNQEDFLPLAKLENVDLSHNSISEMDYEIFNSSTKLKSLHLEANPIRNIDCSTLALIKKGASVFIPWKDIGEFQMEWCEDNKIHVSSDQPEGFFYTSDGKIELHCTDQSFENINIFQMDGNQFENALEMLKCLSPSLRWLKLGGNFSETLSSTSLDRFFNLEDLLIRDIQLPNFDFITLKNQKSLASFDLTRNNLRTVSNIPILDTLETLEYVEIGENQLQNTMELIQHLSPTVKALRLSGNHVGKLNVSTFSRLNNLQVLTLKNTGISFSDINPFESLKELRELDVSFNDLEHVNFALLSSTLENLLEFHAAGSKIVINSEFIRLFGPSLLKLDLSANTLGDLNANAFEKLENLQELRLDMIDTPNFDFAILEPLKNLQTLNVSYNNLNKVNLDLLSTKLQELYLEGNNLNEIEHLAQSRFPKMFEFAISKNQFSCEYLATFLPQIKIEWPDLKLKGDPWVQKNNDCRIKA